MEDIISLLRAASRRVAEARSAVADLAASTPIISSDGRSAIPDLYLNDVHRGLQQLSPQLGQSYLQVLSDIGDTSRTSWAGTAHEIREVLATMLRLLAPDDEVKVKPWFRQEPKMSGPTQKQRVRFILESHGAGSKESEVMGQVVILDDMAGDLVRATYSRASDAAHRFKTRKEVVRVVKYFDAFAHDLLNLE